jgi:hypothetical protein
MLKFLMLKNLLLLSLFTSCAFVHRHQIQNVDHRILSQDSKKFEFMLSETGIELAEGAAWVRAFSSSGSSVAKGAENFAAIIALIQMGPRTGNPVYNTRLTSQLHTKISQICPAGQEVTGLTFMREMNKYPVVSGEIIKVSGHCVKRIH